jgi:tRNA (cmo5U34)-methyltransferase
MLKLLVENHMGHEGQIEVVEASYVDWDYPQEAFDLVVSSNTMHHFWEAEKAGIYRKILSSLKPGGAYVESDFIVDAWCEKQYMKRYEVFAENLGRAPEPGEFHIDIPFTIERQARLLKEAGFRLVEVLDDSVQPSWSGAILKATK